MVVLPRGVADLNLAPVALAIDARIEELAGKTPDQLAFQIRIATNRAGRTPEARQSELLEAIAYLTDTHGWKLSMDARGVRMTHGQYSVVFGIPDTFSAFVAGP
jgi:glutamine cyclotransferase